MKMPLISFFTLTASLSLLSMEMKVFNVGQGNCTVVKDSHYDTLLVDAGSSSLPQDSPTKKIVQNIISYTSSERKPVTMVVSHGDKDHYSWIPTIIRQLRRKKIPVSLILGGTHTDYVPANEKTTNTTLDDLRDLCNELDGHYAEDLPKEDLDDLLPPYAQLLAALTTKGGSANKRSIVIKIIPLDAIIPGDANGITMRALKKRHPKLQATHYVAAHHGAHAEECNTISFLTKLAPQTIMVSAGIHDSYKHPTGTFIKRALAVLTDNVRLHQLTFHPNDETYISDDCLPYLVYSNGYVTTLTRKPVYTTIDAGDITLRNDDDKQHLRSQQNLGLFGVLKNPPVHTIVELHLTQGLIESNQLMKLRELPRTLRKIHVAQPIKRRGVMWLVHLTRSNKEITIYLSDVPFLVEEFEHYILKNFYFSLLRKSQFYIFLAPENTDEELIQQQLVAINREHEPLDEDTLLHIPIYALHEDKAEPIVISHERYADAYIRHYPKKTQHLLNEHN